MQTPFYQTYEDYSAEPYYNDGDKIPAGGWVKPTTEQYNTAMQPWDSLRQSILGYGGPDITNDPKANAFTQSIFGEFYRDNNTGVAGIPNINFSSESIARMLQRNATDPYKTIMVGNDVDFEEDKLNTMRQYLSPEEREQYRAQQEAKDAYNMSRFGDDWVYKLGKMASMAAMGGGFAAGIGAAAGGAGVNAGGLDGVLGDSFSGQSWWDGSGGSVGGGSEGFGGNSFDGGLDGPLGDSFSDQPWWNGGNDFSSVMPPGANTNLPASLNSTGMPPSLSGTSFAGSEPTLMQKLKELYSLASPALSIGSGLVNLFGARRGGAAADPFAASGGRALADSQLQALLRGDVDNDPALRLRIRAAQRAMGSYGQNSGNMAVAAANASTDWYNQRLQQLGGLAGAGFNPAGAAGVRNQMQQQALGQIGFGLNQAFGSNGMSPAMMAQLRSLGYQV